VRGGARLAAESVEQPLAVSRRRSLRAEWRTASDGARHWPVRPEHSRGSGPGESREAASLVRVPLCRQKKGESPYVSTTSTRILMRLFTNFASQTPCNRLVKL
jgi:hypothetical protein